MLKKRLQPTMMYTPSSSRRHRHHCSSSSSSSSSSANDGSGDREKLKITIHNYFIFHKNKIMIKQIKGLLWRQRKRSTQQLFNSLNDKRVPGPTKKGVLQEKSYLHQFLKLDARTWSKQ